MVDSAARKGLPGPRLRPRGGLGSGPYRDRDRGRGYRPGRGQNALHRQADENVLTFIKSIKLCDRIGLV